MKIETKNLWKFNANISLMAIIIILFTAFLQEWTQIVYAVFLWSIFLLELINEIGPKVKVSL